MAWLRWVSVLALIALAGPVQAQQRYDLEGEGWVRQTPAAPGSAEAELEGIRKLIAEGEGKKAKAAADAWIEAHPNHALMPEALLIRGDANVAREHFFKSLFDYEQLIREYPGSDQFHTALQREFELAKLFMAGTKRRLWGMRILPATDEAEEVLVRIQERNPGSDLGELASITLADYYFDKPQMESAADAYDLFLVNYPGSERKEWAMLRLIQANLARFKGPRFDATGLIDAGQRLKTYRREYPASAERMGVDALLIRIDESLAMRDMVAADWHVLRKQPLSATYLYQRVIQDYPKTAAAQDAIVKLADLGAEPWPVDEMIEPVAVEPTIEIPLEPAGTSQPASDPVPETEASSQPTPELLPDVEAEPQPVAEPQVTPEPQPEPEPITAPDPTAPMPEKP